MPLQDISLVYFAKIACLVYTRMLPLRHTLAQCYHKDFGSVVVDSWFICSHCFYGSMFGLFCYAVLSIFSSFGIIFHNRNNLN